MTRAEPVRRHRAASLSLGRFAPLLVAALLTLAFLAAAAAPAGAAPGGLQYPRSFAVTDDSSSSGSGLGKDAAHRALIVANLRAEVPDTPSILLLGGSSARESTVDDRSWAQQILDFGGTPVVTYNLGCRHDTYAQDLAVARLLPTGMPSIVLIGINIGRFCNSPSSPTIDLPEPRIPPPVYYQHVYSIHKRIQSASLKRFYVQYWLSSRWPEFQANYDYNLGVIESIVRTCLNRGLNPVLVDLPRDLPIIGHAFDQPVAMYKDGCARLAARYQIPWLTFVAASGFVDHDFFDLFHLVEPGRAKYQEQLSTRSVRLLKKFGLDEPPTPTPTPTPTVTPTPSPTPTVTPTASPTASPSALPSPSAAS